MKKFFRSITLLTLLSSLILPVSADSRKTIIGKTAPSFVLPNIKGQQKKLSDWKNRFIVLNFWATWCTPCKKEIPLFNEFQNSFSDDVQFIGIAIDNKKDVEKFSQLIPLNYPNLLGGLNASQLIMTYGNNAGVLPYTVFINRSGKIVTVASGEINKKFLLETLEKYL